MTTKAFAVALTSSLIKQGINKETAVSNVMKLTHSLTEEDYREIAGFTSEEDFAGLTDSLVTIILQTEKEKDNNFNKDNNMDADTIALPRNEINDPSLAATKTIDCQEKIQESTPSEMRTRIDLPADNTQKAHYTEYAAVKLTERGKKFFVTISIFAFPVAAVIALLYFGVFALCITSVCAMILISFAFLAALIIAGSLSGLVGIIFGIIQMFSSVGIGLYEIGVGIAAGGVTVILSVLVYHFATLVLPYVLRQLCSFFKHTLRRISELLDKFREECNRL